MRLDHRNGYRHRLQIGGINLFQSFRSRLLLSYVLVIVTIVCAMSTGIILALRQNPLLFRQSALNVRAAVEAAELHLNAMEEDSSSRIPEFIESEAQRYQVNLVFFTENGEILAEGGANRPALHALIKRLAEKKPPTGNVRLYRFNRGTVWIYSIKQIASGEFVMAAVSRVDLPFRVILQDEMVRPLFWGIGGSFLLAIVLSLLLTHSINQPLKKIARSALDITEQKYGVLPEEGLSEVRQLSKAFNVMMKRLKISQQAQRDLVANISHDLKTPITSIQGFAQALLDETVKDDAGKIKAATVIREEAERMNRMVMDLLTLSRLEAGIVEMQFETVDLNSLMNSVIENLLPQSSAASVQLKFVPINPVQLTGDGDRLRQVFTNIIENAIKFSPSDSEVIIQTEQDKNHVMIKFSDNGQGMHPEDRERVFERFYQVDKARTGSGKRGTGLGLAIAKEIIIAHGGTIIVESEWGKGSTFIISLPKMQRNK